MGNEQYRHRQYGQYGQNPYAQSAFPQQQQYMQSRSLSPNFKQQPKFAYQNNNNMNMSSNNIMNMSSNNMNDLSMNQSMLNASMISQNNMNMGAAHQMQRRRKRNEEIGKVFVKKYMDPTVLDNPDIFDRNTLTSKPVAFMDHTEAQQYDAVKHSPHVSQKLDHSKNSKKHFLGYRKNKKSDVDFLNKSKSHSLLPNPQEEFLNQSQLNQSQLNQSILNQSQISQQPNLKFTYSQYPVEDPNKSILNQSQMNQSMLNQSMMNRSMQKPPQFAPINRQNNHMNTSQLSQHSPNFNQNIMPKQQNTLQVPQQQQPNRVTFMPSVQQSQIQQDQNQSQFYSQNNSIFPIKRKVASFKSRAVKEQIDQYEQVHEVAQAMEFCTFFNHIQIDKSQNSYLNSSAIQGLTISNANMDGISDDKQTLLNTKIFAKNMQLQDNQQKEIMAPEHPFLTQDQKQQSKISSDLLQNSSIANNNNVLQPPQQRTMMTFSSKTDSDIAKKLIGLSKNDELPTIKEPENKFQTKTFEYQSYTPLQQYSSVSNNNNNFNKYSSTTNNNNDNDFQGAMYHSTKNFKLNYNTSQNNQSTSFPSEIPRNVDRSYLSTYQPTSPNLNNSYQIKVSPPNKSYTSIAPTTSNNNINNDKYNIKNDVNSSDCDHQLNFKDQSLKLGFKLSPNKAKKKWEQHRQERDSGNNNQQQKNNRYGHSQNTQITPDLEKPNQYLDRIEQFEKEVDHNINRINNNGIGDRSNSRGRPPVVPNYAQSARYDNTQYKSFNFPTTTTTTHYNNNKINNIENNNNNSIYTANITKNDMTQDDLFQPSKPYVDFLSRQELLKNPKQQVDPVIEKENEFKINFENNSIQQQQQQQPPQDLEELIKRSSPPQRKSFKNLINRGNDQNTLNNDVNKSQEQSPAYDISQLNNRYMTYEDQINIQKFQNESKQFLKPKKKEDQNMKLQKGLIEKDSPPISQKDLYKRRKSKQYLSEDEDSMDLSPRSHKSQKSSRSIKSNRSRKRSRSKKSQKKQKQQQYIPDPIQIQQQQNNNINNNNNYQQQPIAPLLPSNNEESPEKQRPVSPIKTPYDTHPYHQQQYSNTKRSTNNSSNLSSNSFNNPQYQQQQQPLQQQQQQHIIPKQQQQPSSQQQGKPIQLMPSLKYKKNLESNDNPMLPQNIYNKTPTKNKKYDHIKPRYNENFAKKPQKNQQKQQQNYSQQQQPQQQQYNYQNHQYYENDSEEDVQNTSDYECAQVHLTLQLTQDGIVQEVDPQQNQQQEQQYHPSNNDNYHNNNNYENTAWDNQYNQHYSNNNSIQNNQQQYNQYQPPDMQQLYNEYNNNNNNLQQQQQQQNQSIDNTLDLNYNEFNSKGPEVQHLNIQDILQEYSQEEDNQYDNQVQPQPLELSQSQRILDNNMDFNKKYQYQSNGQQQQYY